MAFKLGTMSIFELGQFISSKLKEDGVTIQSELTVYVTSEEFKKIDEDLYYRNRKDESQEFIPSEGEIDINFELVKIIVKENECYKN
jgi:hypothetical protein